MVVFIQINMIFLKETATKLPVELRKTAVDLSNSSHRRYSV